jgi:hypothetical protein
MAGRRNTSGPYTLLILILALLLAACGGGTSNAPDVHQLIKDAQAAIQKVQSYHFTLTAENIGTNGTLPITSAEGDIKVPDKLKATANAFFLGSIQKIQIIAIGNQQYIYVAALGSWQTTTGLIDPRTLSDPQTGVAAILGQIQNPSQPTDSNVDGRSCWSFSGQLNPTSLAGITGGGAPAGTLDNVTACIGKNDNLPYEIMISGVAAMGDTDKTVRTFKLSNFGEQVDITAPVTSSTPTLPPLTPPPVP